MKRWFFPALLLLLPPFDLAAREPQRVQRMLALNAEFDHGLARWTPTGGADVSVAIDAELSGRHALQVTLTDRSPNATVYQETDLAFSMNDDTYRHSGKALSPSIALR